MSCLAAYLILRDIQHQVLIRKQDGEGEASESKKNALAENQSPAYPFMATKEQIGNLTALLFLFFFFLKKNKKSIWKMGCIGTKYQKLVWNVDSPTKDPKRK